MQLRDDDILVVAWITDQGALDCGAVAWQVARVRIDAAVYWRPEQEGAAVVVEVGLVVRAPAIDVIEIEGWRTKIHQRIRIILFLKTARWIEGNVVIHELAEIGVQRGNLALLIVLSHLGIGRIGRRGHRHAQLRQVRHSVGVGIAKDRWLKRSEETAELALELRRPWS